ncbi:DNA-directed RNA polymerase I and III polypeptide [Diplocarpon mali]|nr:DNA-directed RNA polymerase I and III polypeptide [Diplocarpon mali]
MPPKKKATTTAVSNDEDVSMSDALAVEEGSPAPATAKEEPWVDEQRIRIDDRADLNSFLSPDVEFCGYSIPHPSEELMNIRIQTYEGTTAVAALDKGFADLIDLCDVVATKFIDAREEFTASKNA